VRVPRLRRSTRLRSPGRRGWRWRGSQGRYVRGRFQRRGPALLVSVVLTALAIVVLVPGAGAAPGDTTTTTDPVSTTTSSTLAPTTTVAATTTKAPTTTVVEEVVTEPVVTTTRRPTTTTLRPPTTTARSSTTTSSTTSTTVAAVVVPTTSRPATITSSTLLPDTASGNETRSRIDRIVRLLFGIAGLTAVLGVGFAWYTSPRRRVRVAERKAADASRRLDDAVAASFVGTTIALDRASDTSDDTAVIVADDVPIDEDDDSAREGLASKLFPRRDDDIDDPDRPNPRPDPRPRPNDSPWEP
jgi:hypothetical protein